MIHRNPSLTGLLLLSIFMYTAEILYSQIIVETYTPLEEMVEKIIGEGVIYDNVTYQGADMARASFQNGNTTNLGLDEGIILCTGDPNLIPGINDNCYSSHAYFLPGHPLLNSITFLGETCDASVLEFDVVPETDSLIFRFVFGSEAWGDGASTPFQSDIFGCFVTGVNPSGGAYVNKNIAIVPGTVNESIQPLNINNGTVFCPTIPSGPCNNCEYYIDNIGGTTLQYDGITTVLEASVGVIPCETYHILIGVGDSFQWHFHDSGVFIEETDYQSPKMEITLSTDTTSSSLIEGCASADIIFKLPDLKYAPAIVSLNMSGSTADPDNDFEETLPTELTFEEGQDSISLHIQPIKDGIAEGDEVLQVIIEYSLTCPVYYDTIEIVISDYFDMAIQTPPDTSVCQGEETTLWVNVENGIPPYNFNWEGISSTNDTLTIYPNENSWYYVQVTDQCADTIVDSIYVEVIPEPEVTLGIDTTICTGDEITLLSPTGIYQGYLWSTGDTTASITVNQPDTYSLTVFNECGEAQDNITIGQYPYPDPQLGPNLQICYGETAQLQAAYGFLSYTWQDNSTEDFYPVTQSGLYYVEVEDIHGCNGTDTVVAEVASIVNFPQDTMPLCQGETAALYAGSGFDFYTWSTGETGTDSISINHQGWYSVAVVYYYGCESVDSIYAETYPEPHSQITGPDFLCEGDTIILTGQAGNYQYYWNNELSNSNQLMVTEGGTYTLKMVNVCGEDTDNKTIVIHSLPEINLGDDQLLFPGEEITLNAGSYDSITWNNNTTGQYYTIRYSDITDKDSLWVMVSDGFCKNTDGIIIDAFDVQVPSVITPNGDGANDLFIPLEDATGITRIYIMVFNRWGEKLWESSNFPIAWDGKQNGRLVADGTYFWILEVWYGKDELKKVYKGSLTVLGSGG